MTKFKQRTRVRHTKKMEWGVGQILADSSIESVEVFFEHAGEKSLALSHAHLDVVEGEAAISIILDSLDFDAPAPTGKSVCGNCGSATTFGESATIQRVNLGWCGPCFRNSQRTFEDNVTGEKRSFDEFRTVDGIKSRYSPK